MSKELELENEWVLFKFKHKSIWSGQRPFWNSWNRDFRAPSVFSRIALNGWNAWQNDCTDSAFPAQSANTSIAFRDLFYQMRCKFVAAKHSDIIDWHVVVRSMLDKECLP